MSASWALTALNTNNAKLAAGSADRIADRNAALAIAGAAHAAAAATARTAHAAAAAAAAHKQFVVISALFKEGMVSKEEWTEAWQLTKSTARAVPGAMLAPGPALARSLNASASAARAVAPLVPAQIGGRGVAAAGLHGHSDLAMGAEAAAPSAPAAMAFAAPANMPASSAVTAAAVNVPADIAGHVTAMLPSQPSQSSRGRQLKPSERKTNQDVPGTGNSPILTDPQIGLISRGV